MTVSAYRGFVRGTGFYDATLMVLFIFPGLVSWTLVILDGIDDKLALPGDVGEVRAFGLLAMNMMAAVTMVWAVARAHEPHPAYGFWDGVARVQICGLLVFYVAFSGVSAFMLVFALIEAVLGAVGLWGYAQINSRASRPA